MTDENFRLALSAFCRRRPFGFFWIEFQSGDRVLVKHPEAARIRGPLVLYVAPDRLQRIFDTASVCQLIESAPDQPQKKG